MPTDRPYWFADVDRDQEPPYVWQPCLETLTGHIPCFDVWFDSKEECEKWIREFVIGAELESEAIVGIAAEHSIQDPFTGEITVTVNL